ncbi:Surfactin synthase thioesterase subunit [Lentzea waywayandensis]|uniref:Surfactin synthase thioesterase subunit n=1 Tax=Lentzea waywayandensis TaxID=84724 RepID=A0A1I6FFN8_9PSEU|nr:alpha/beta fold hydrolase [Lentzea waywayandensis]SFR28724.1 Surfactin synthase thioesterase subunit [Lentzea waywayandensis]
MRFNGSHIVVERPGAEVRLLMFHHAGGSAMSYLPLARALPQECEPVLFELSGRGMRPEVAPPGDFRAALDDLLPAVVSVVDRPVVVFGHSLGALLAHSLVSSLPAEQRKLVRAVVVSAFTSPTDALAEADPLVVRSRAQLLAELESRGGCPPELFEDDELREHAITLLGHDLHLADTYVVAPPWDGDVDYHVWYGRQDEHLDVDAVERWEASTPRPPVVRGFRGGHFYLDGGQEAKTALSRVVRSALHE